MATPPGSEKPERPTKEVSQRLPPPLVEPVPPPLSNIRFHRFIYSLVFLISLIGAYYSHRLIQIKTEIGGLWKNPFTTAQHQHQQQHVGSVEERINQLAQALGMSSDILAGAIASAVREHVPPASLSSIAGKETGSAVRKLVGHAPTGGGREWSKGGAVAAAASAASDGVGGVVDGIVNGMGIILGADELELDEL